MVKDIECSQEVSVKRSWVTLVVQRRHVSGDWHDVAYPRDIEQAKKAVALARAEERKKNVLMRSKHRVLRRTAEVLFL